MSTPYNLREGLLRAAETEKHVLADPGTGGTVQVWPVGLSVVVLEGAGGRTLQPAAQIPVGTRVIAISQTDGVTVNSVPLDNGMWAEFVVVLNSSGAHTWGTGGASVELPASAGTYEFGNDTTVDAVDVRDGIVAIVGALDAAGLIDASGITVAA